MSLQIYDSLQKKKVEFKPQKKGEVSLYVCGPTVYDEPHIGHLRSAYVFELIRNTLTSLGYNVVFVRNVTDVDDKIIDKARTLNIDLKDAAAKISRQYAEEYDRALRDLGLAEPTRKPYATAHIEPMKTLAKKLIEKGRAYEAEGDVYFDVEKFENYGQLSGQKKDQMLEGTRLEINEKKRNPLDFALWKSSAPNEPSWDSDWGPGRPGWHIECSAMSMEYLGETIDIHGGGRDLIFPHHENEIAQSEAVTGRTFARYWIHHGLITVDGQKMSKSLKNYITLEKFRKAEWGTEILKLFFLKTHYRAPLDYSERSLAMAYAEWKKIFYFLEEAHRLSKKYQSAPNTALDGLKNSLLEALNDDFNTPQALAVLHEIMHFSRKSADPSVILRGAAIVGEFLSRICCLGRNLEPHFDAKSSLDLAAGVNAKMVDVEIQKRIQCRKIKDFNSADAIRAKLAGLGIELVDLVDGNTSWRVKV